MTPQLTEDQFHWVCVAIENSLEAAKKLQQEARDTDEALDAGLLINRYTDLQRLFPPSQIGRAPPE